jgi:transcriptional regulator of NAD metabolism
MQTGERRAAIETMLRNAGQPVTGSQLAAAFGVSRQVIVQDMAVLRAGGLPVEASAQGYYLRTAGKAHVCVIASCHRTREALLAELYAIVDAGATVEDIIVEHPVYGEIVGNLHVDSRKAADLLSRQLYHPQAAPLSTVTGGFHLHTLSAPDQATLERAVAALKRLDSWVELAEE